MAGVRQFNEDQVFDSALALFWDKGYTDTTMQDLAAATGVQRGSLYHAYQDKETLFLRVFERYRSRFLEQVETALASPDLYTALRGFIDLLITSMLTGQPTRGCLSTKTALSNDVFHEPIRHALQGILDGYSRLLRQRLARPDAAQGLALPAEQAIELILTFTRGLVVIERVYQDPERLRASSETLLSVLLKKPGQGPTNRKRPANPS
ncbi:MAG TPA: TetR/AcrR family transcriptional regulator [Bordetella sp.]